MCERIIDYYDTANNPVYKIKCNCGTTACQKLKNFRYYQKNITLTSKLDDIEEVAIREEKEFYRKHCLI